LGRSAYFLFCADERPKVKATDSSLSLGDTAKELGRRWAAVDAATKSKYEKAAGKDKERYERVRQKENGVPRLGQWTLGSLTSLVKFSPRLILKLNVFTQEFPLRI
jgi:HMG (high mobility group) box